MVPQAKQAIDIVRASETASAAVSPMKGKSFIKEITAESKLGRIEVRCYFTKQGVDVHHAAEATGSLTLPVLFTHHGLGHSMKRI